MDAVTAVLVGKMRALEELALCLCAPAGRLFKYRVLRHPALLARMIDDVAAVAASSVRDYLFALPLVLDGSSGGSNGSGSGSGRGGLGGAGSGGADWLGTGAGGGGGGEDSWTLREVFEAREGSAQEEFAKLDYANTIFCVFNHLIAGTHAPTHACTHAEKRNERTSPGRLAFS